MEATRTYLELSRESQFRPGFGAFPDLVIERVERPTPELYRECYRTVGEAYHWRDRWDWTDAEIRAHLAQPEITLHVARRRRALADAQAHHRRRADRARAAVRAVYVVRPDVDLLERRARRLRAEVFQEGVDLQDLGGRAGVGVHPGDDVGEVLFHRAGGFRRRAHQPKPGQACGAELQTAHGHPDELLRRDRVFRRGREGRRMTTSNSFGARAPLKAAGGTFEIFRLDSLERRGLPVARLPYSLRILLENLLRREDGRTVTPAEIERLA